MANKHKYINAWQPNTISSFVSSCQHVLMSKYPIKNEKQQIKQWSTKIYVHFFILATMEKLIALSSPCSPSMHKIKTKKSYVG
jgi:hypothetical protein